MTGNFSSPYFDYISSWLFYFVSLFVLFLAWIFYEMSLILQKGDPFCILQKKKLGSYRTIYYYRGHFKINITVLVQGWREI